MSASCDALILHTNQASFQLFMSINEYDLKFKTKSVAKGDQFSKKSSLV